MTQLSADELVPDYVGGLTGRLEGLTVGIAKRFYYDDYDTPDDIRAAFDAIVVVLEDLGAQVVTADLPELMDFHAVGRLMLPAEAYAIHEEKLKTRWREFGPLSRNRMMLGAFVRSSDYLQAQRRRNELAL